MKKPKIVLVIILISVILFASLGFLGYFGVKTMRRSRLRAEAREAFAAADWKTAEKLLLELKSVKGIKEASLERLSEVVGPAKAKIVYEHFK